MTDGPDPTSVTPRRRWWRWVLALLVLALVLIGAAAGAGWWYYEQACQDPCADLSVFQPFAPYQTSVVYDRSGVEIARFFVEDRRVTPLGEIPPTVREAFLAIEDARFYRHGGVDVRRVIGAALANLRSDTRQGASTITMQLARNVFPDLLPARERTIERKLREIHVARAIEGLLPKDTILQDYLNTIYLGAGAYGVDAAARAYFAKPIGEVTLAEAALLAALPRAPSASNPFRRPAAARARRDLVLDRMRALQWIGPDAWAAARTAPLDLAADPSSEVGLASQATVGAYFVETVRRDLQRELGPTLYRGGYQIHTSLDAGFQAIAEEVAESALVQIERGSLGSAPRPARGAAAGEGEALRSTAYLQAGVAVVDADSGDVLVLIGGRSFAESPFNRMTQAWRQPGSAFKPFVYAAALREGWAPTDLVSDGPVAVPRPGGIVWRPQNFNPREVNGSVTLETALARSLNRATVRLGMQVGLGRVLDAAEQMGLPGPLPRVPAVLLGSADVHPLDLLAAYLPLARADGHRVRPRFILRVLDPLNHEVLRRLPEIEPGLPPDVTAQLRQMLTRTVDMPRGTGGSIRRNGYEGPVAGKTGTTNGTTNTWFLGVTPDYAAGVWVGFDQPRAILPDSNATGGRVAAPIWAAIMKRAPVRRTEWPVAAEPDTLPASIAPPVEPPFPTTPPEEPSP